MPGGLTLGFAMHLVSNMCPYNVCFAALALLILTDWRIDERSGYWLGYEEHLLDWRIVQSDRNASVGR